MGGIKRPESIIDRGAIKRRKGVDVDGILTAWLMKILNFLVGVGGQVDVSSGPGPT